MTTRDMALAALMAALTAAGALVSIPLSPVPFTFQVLFVLMAGLVLRPAAAASAMTVYLLIGIAGMPVFSKGQSGLATLAGPTGGYLIGFVLAAWVVSLVAGPSRVGAGVGRRALAVALGLVVIYAPGAAWLAVSTGMGVLKAIAVGVVPFVPLDVVKGIIAVAGAAALDRVPEARRA